MKIKVLVFTTALSFLFQILFSIYYSIKIVDENSQFNNHQKILQDISIQHQHLEIETAKLQSLSSLVQSSTKFSFLPVKSILDLSK